MTAEQDDDINIIKIPGLLKETKTGTITLGFDARIITNDHKEIGRVFFEGDNLFIEFREGLCLRYNKKTDRASRGFAVRKGGYDGRSET